MIQFSINTVLTDFNCNNNENTHNVYDVYVKAISKRKENDKK